MIGKGRGEPGFTDDGIWILLGLDQSSQDLPPDTLHRLGLEMRFIQGQSQQLESGIPVGTQGPQTT